LKTTANDQFPRLLPPLVNERTAVVTLQNGLGNEEDLAQLFPREQILGGLCFVCLNRLEPGVVRHTAHGKIVLGEFSGWPEPRTHDVASAIRHAGVPCSVTDNLPRAHWQKLVWNIPFNGLGVASAAGFDAFESGQLPANAVIGRCLPTDELLADTRWGPLVRELMLEVIAAANALDLSISETYADHQIDRTRLMGAYFASTLVDFERRQPLELKALFQEPLRQAGARGLVMPQLKRLHRVLKRLDPVHPARERLSWPEAER
jgi:2-dehydropantoate 2-reductase